MEEQNKYYVYEHIRLDNNTCFYVGKGTGKRAYCETRNVHHDNIVKKHGMTVKIIKDGLSEKEAYELEKERIHYYVFELGYSINIIGYNNGYDKTRHLTNSTFGGDGSNGMVHTEEWKKQHSFDMMGENNPMYGVNVWEMYSEEKANEVRQKISKSSKGENNPMYGVTPQDRMSADVYAEWLEKTSSRLKNQCGENNPNYGNTTLHDKVKNNPELRIQYYSRPGSQNGRAKPIFVYDLNNNFLAEFGCIKDCGEWLRMTYGIKNKIDSMRPYILCSAETGTPYKNLLFSFERKTFT